VIGDWTLPDKAKAPLFQDLVHVHEALGKPWRTFLPSGRKFLEMMRSSKTPYFYPKEMSLSFLTPIQFKEELIRLIQSKKPEDNQPLLRVLLTLTFDEIKNLLAISRDGSLKKSETKFAKGQLKHRLIKRLQNSVVAARKVMDVEFFYNRVMEEYLVSLFLKIEMQSELGMPVYLRKSDQEFISIEGQRVLIHGGTATAEFDMQKSQNPGVIGLKQTQMYPSVPFPVIHWTTDTQGAQPKRTFHLGNTGVTEFEEKDGFHPALFEHGNPLLGLIAIAYLSPSIRGKRPRYLRSPKSDRPQINGPGQVPVAVLYPSYNMQLSQASLLEALEAVAE
jgi:hypothetical protein